MSTHRRPDMPFARRMGISPPPSLASPKPDIGAFPGPSSPLGVSSSKDSGVSIPHQCRVAFGLPSTPRTLTVTLRASMTRRRFSMVSAPRSPSRICSRCSHSVVSASLSGIGASVARKAMTFSTPSAIDSSRRFRTLCRAVLALVAPLGRLATSSHRFSCLVRCWESVCSKSVIRASVAAFSQWRSSWAS
jgi:hypothetical protein